MQNNNTRIGEHTLPDAFKRRMKALLGEEYDRFIACFSASPVRGLRVNTLKISVDDFLAISPWKLSQSQTLEEGFIFSDTPDHIGTSAEHMAGMFYVQEPSAMSVIEKADIHEGQFVLDLCAAPGGKSGGAAARLNGTGLLVSNEIVPSRAKLLARNLERLGVMNSVVTNAHPDTLACSLPEFFDRVLVDAPCSGEGMFRKDPNAAAEWSVEHVAACAKRQKMILESAEKLVRPGGKLIYSTCTFSREENESVVEDFLEKHSEYTLEFCSRLYPHTCQGEGHFVARLANTRPSLRRTFAPFAGRIDNKLLNGVNEFLSDTFTSFPTGGFFDSLPSGSIRYFPFFCLPGEIAKLPIISMGLEIGEQVKGRIKPAHALFMACGNRSSLAFKAKNVLDLAPDSNEVRQFLAGNTLKIDDSLSGFMPVAVHNCSLGFGKAVAGTLKNHLPKGLMIAAYR